MSPEQRLWDVDNVLVCDSSVFVTSAGYNPTLTLAALAHRAATLLAGTARTDAAGTGRRSAHTGGLPRLATTWRQAGVAATADGTA